MNATKIDRLIAKRDRLLTRRDGLYDSEVINRIDAQLAQVEPGVDNRVDLALGRACAVHPAYYTKAAPVVVVVSETQANIAALYDAATSAGAEAEWLTPEQVARLEAMCDEQGGIIEHYDSATEGAWK